MRASAPQDLETPRRFWRIGLDICPIGFPFIKEAIKIIRSSPNIKSKDTDYAEKHIAEYIARILLELGHGIHQIEMMKGHILEEASTVRWFINKQSIKIDNDPRLSALVNEFVAGFPDLINNRSANQSWCTQTISCILIEDLKSIIENSREFDIIPTTLREELTKRIAFRLGEAGMSSTDAARIARTTVTDFQRSAGSKAVHLTHAFTADLAAQLVASFTRALNKTPTESFGLSAENSVSIKEPELRWKNRDDRLPKETPIEFLRRVWGEWLDSGELYQDVMTHFGEDRLVRAVRDYCRARELDANEYLPPPKRVRTDREFATAEPGARRQELRKLVRRRKRPPPSPA
ncbi:hypothetical protein OF829_08860 [Sphingomonas sp. LB-2]|uniref:hypothetical protein n=1 Tax=Sphingomonas caeni TaxID=2984949 RepID=UPI00222F649E|nr:hypothetical protein [Sphingomonas caeni]MCW3847350.1 hypothetical protein [Sphingomonas caeni]